MSKCPLTLSLIFILLMGVCVGSAPVGSVNHDDHGIPLVLEEESLEKVDIEISIDFDYDYIDQYSLNCVSIITFFHLVCENCYVSFPCFSTDVSRAPPV